MRCQVTSNAALRIGSLCAATSETDSGVRWIASSVGMGILGMSMMRIPTRFIKSPRSSHQNGAPR